MVVKDQELYHIGMPMRSGRYPWGSGKDPYQSAIGWQAHIKKLREEGFSDSEIAEFEGIKLYQLKARDSIAKDEFRAGQRSMALTLKDKGYGATAIGERMGLAESSVRALLDPVLAERAEIRQNISNLLKEQVDKHGYIDIGKGVSNHLGIAPTKLNTAVAYLVEQGYKKHRVNVAQAGIADQFTVFIALGKPESEWKEIAKDPSLIKEIDMISDDFGRSFKSVLGLDPVQSISSDRIKIQYGEEGKSKDGVIELRRGVKDLDLGGAQYAQVRIGVDETRFMKGMALYRNDMPDGIDVIFNTNKHDTGNKLDALKTMNADMSDPKVKEITNLKLSKDETDKLINKGVRDGIIRPDPDNPFGATIKEGSLGQRGALNVLNEEGDWNSWSKTISSQMLSKQTVQLAKTQLDLSLKEKQDEHEKIMELTNPVIKKQLLLAFADDCDASAVHLKAAGLPRQASKVILPVPSLKPTEVYAPTFKDGESVVLIRHPHGGRFEIPAVIVNNKSKEAKAIMENAIDAIGINPKVAQKLSGADFDGDTVIVIPNNSGLIKSEASLKDLENFDPIERYRIPEGSKVKSMIEATKQIEMGKISNLITDMTIKGANVDKIVRAVKHSMVVIDAVKHDLDYRQSYKDNGIAALAKEYQNSAKGGASTIISRAKSKLYNYPLRVPRKAADGGPIDPYTGEKVYTFTGETYTNKKGEVITKKKAVKQMEVAKNALDLSSGRPIEIVYAGYANELKALANESRRSALAIIPTPYSPSAFVAYREQVNSLNAQLDIAQRNSPLERQAQALTDSIVRRKKEANPDMDSDDEKKVRNQALAEMRSRTGAKKNRVKVTSEEWEAIQAGAIHPSRLVEIYRNADVDQIKALATPRNKPLMTVTNISRARLMLNNGATLAEVSESLGVSISTLSKALK